MGINKRGRPAQRPEWANRVWDALFSVHPAGMRPRDLRQATGLTAAQVRAAADYLRGVFKEENDPPVVYVRRPTEEVEGNMWYIAPTWQDHTRASIVSEYLRQSESRLHSAEQLLEKAARAFPQRARRIKKVRRNAQYLREEIGDLLTDLAV
jgi:hypothetical protein